MTAHDDVYLDEFSRTRQSIRRFAQVMDEMKQLNREALDIVRDVGTSQDVLRARSYWYAHIEGAVDKQNSEFLGGSMMDMNETFEDLQESKEDE